MSQEMWAASGSGNSKAPDFPIESGEWSAATLTP